MTSKLFTVSKFLITTGKNNDGYQKRSEMIDLTVKRDSKCQDWIDFPRDVVGAIGGLIGNTILICGGSEQVTDQIYDDCYSLIGQKKIFVTRMSTKRTFAASVVIKDTVIWITGGKAPSSRLASTEYISNEGTTMQGSEMPLPISHHALVSINSTCSMMIGGLTDEGPIALTFFYNHEDNNWIEGPSMMQSRYIHATGIVHDEVTQEELVIATGGEFNGIHLQSTEIVLENDWVPGRL